MTEVKHVIQSVADSAKYWTKRDGWGPIEEAKQFTSLPRAYDYAERKTLNGDMAKNYWRIIEL